MIIRAWHRETKEEIPLSILGSKGYKSRNAKLIYQCDKCGKYVESSYDLLRKLNKLSRQECGPCVSTINTPEMKKEKMRLYLQRYYQKNKHRIKSDLKAYRKALKEKDPGKIKEWAAKANKKRAGKPEGVLDNRIGSALYRALKGMKRGRRWEDLVGYTVDELKGHLERLFDGEMSWDNIGEWHIDHIIPKSIFRYESPDDKEFKMCWALSNLQPEWGSVNVSKRNYLIVEGVF